MTDADPVGEVPLRDAATVMLVRDGSEGLEVFMLRRNLKSDFVGGAYVFPGGAVDPHDRHQNLEPICTGRTDADASGQLGIDGGGLAFWVAAIRECFEEAGVLLAYDADEQVVRFDDPTVADRFAIHRKSVDSGERRLVDVCLDERLRLAVDTIYYFSHWITPEGAPRRYDTRFFVTRAPDGQVPLHDNHEVIANLWIRPADALGRAPRPASSSSSSRPCAAWSRSTSSARPMSCSPTPRPSTTCPPSCRRSWPTRVAASASCLPGDADYDHVQPVVLPEGVPMNKLNQPAVAGEGGARLMPRMKVKPPETDDDEPPPPEKLTPFVAKALSPLVRRIVAPNPNVFTGPGTNTYLVGIDEVVVVDPAVDDPNHLDAILGCGGDRIRWIAVTHTHPDHSTGVAELKERTGAEVLGFGSKDGFNRVG